MEIKEEEKAITFAWPPRFLSIFHFLFSILFLAAGCGAPGDPLPPSPPIPAVVTDLAAHQAGDSVLLAFTMPTRSTLGDKLKEVPAVEILRGSLKPDGTPDPQSFQVVETVPGSLVSNFVRQGKAQIFDPISAVGTMAHPGEAVVYRVRLRITQKKTSANSNDVSLKIYPVPERIETLQACLTERGVELKWSAPGRTSAGQPLGAIQDYHVYRGEVDPATAEAAAKDMRQAEWKAPLLQIVATTMPEYLDTGFDYGKTYVYLVRSVVFAGGNSLESSDSRIAWLTPRDIFPPAAPQGLVAAALPGAAPGAWVVDLSWAINLERDLAGYRLYRSDQEGRRGELLTLELLPTPAYRDNSVQAGKHYWYSVTAVDRTGNESVPGAPVMVDVEQPSQ